MNNPQDYIFVTQKKQFNLPKKITPNAILIALEEIKDPGNLLKIFYNSHFLNIEIHPNTLRHITNCVKLIKGLG